MFPFANYGTGKLIIYNLQFGRFYDFHFVYFRISTFILHHEIFSIYFKMNKRWLVRDKTVLWLSWVDESISLEFKFVKKSCGKEVVRTGRRQRFHNPYWGRVVHDFAVAVNFCQRCSFFQYHYHSDRPVPFSLSNLYIALYWLLFEFVYYYYSW